MASCAFVGISLDSALLSREWIRFALGYLLLEHDDVLLVLADRLLAYNKTAALWDLGGGIDLGSAKTKMDQRRDDISRFLAREIGLLPKVKQEHVRVGAWDDYSDSLYITLLRTLRIAYSVIREFRECVDRDAYSHDEKHPETSEYREARHELAVSYVLDETAMAIRITEFTNHSFEYYPDDHIKTLTYLYEDRFRARGLSVSGLIGKPPKRVFRPLRIPPDHEEANSAKRVPAS
jgi:hypothetical protein